MTINYYSYSIVIVLVVVLLTGTIQHDITIKVNDPGVLKNSIDLLSFIMETWSILCQINS